MNQIKMDLFKQRNKPCSIPGGKNHSRFNFFQEQFINPTRNKVRLALYQADFYKVAGKWAGEL